MIRIVRGKFETWHYNLSYQPNPNLIQQEIYYVTTSEGSFLYDVVVVLVGSMLVLRLDAFKIQTLYLQMKRILLTSN